MREKLRYERRVETANEDMYLWPIPQAARDLNENLTQNTGW